MPILVLTLVTKKPVLITAFSHFLLLDTFVSAVCRLLILQFFAESFYDHNICSNNYDPTWSPQNFRHDIVTSVRYQKEYLWQFSHKKRCRVALGAVQVVLVTLVICLTAAQGSLAVTMRRYGKKFDQKRLNKVAVRLAEKPRQSPQPDPEKLDDVGRVQVTPNPDEACHFKMPTAVASTPTASTMPANDLSSMHASEATLNQSRDGDGAVENKYRLASLSEMSEDVDRYVTISRRSSGGRSIRPARASDQVQDRCQMLASSCSCLNKHFASTPFP
ncbi:uncharacterized protein MYCFIDRAFT_195054 [Pseudocercospora fijiensis CIRAD86]|uniref:Uncharacterized protein n=1 Tax=Pseudocercospora fijiensis (strain CIRAD86) TaxID=383855 RepID=M2ZY07_PSEFD|nr:uncharacterized protein MYCFIDRAFT_195054 [Pseudocercospora fijiensis CIRAD86]EME83834.1 hypothetical protein MYCFIDRAFT_195054 [Pseudocercospora fijiensis CIRAD86]